jgi:predicted XRE-type DNA-binding protein
MVARAQTKARRRKAATKRLSLAALEAATSAYYDNLTDAEVEENKIWGEFVSRGSESVFRDLGYKNADVEQFKAILAAEIIKALDRERLTVRGAHGRTGIAAADFSRIRNADLGRFTVDRLMSVINRLGSRIEVKIRVRRAEGVGRAATA